MTKGTDHPVYAQWCRMATQQWPGFAADLEEETGYDVELEWTGGAIHAFGEEEFQTHTRSIETIKQACRKVDLDYAGRGACTSPFFGRLPECACYGQFAAAPVGHSIQHGNYRKGSALDRINPGREGLISCTANHHYPSGRVYSSTIRNDQNKTYTALTISTSLVFFAVSLFFKDMRDH